MKSVLITGCSNAGGIGAALAEAFRQMGYHVFATARTPSTIPSTLSSASEVTLLQLDVLSSDSIAAAVEAVSLKTGGRLDVLVNNSGTSIIMPALDVDINAAKQIFDLNFWAPLVMFRAFAPLLIEAKGCLVNNTSANAVTPMPLMSIYSASKAALAVASETWRHELAPLGVRTITLLTTGVNTGAFQRPDRKPIVVPESSRYYGIRDFIIGVGDGRLQKGAIPASVYAASVVREVEKGAYGTVWAGTQAFMARIGVALTPKWAFDMLVQSIVPIGKAMAKAGMKRE